MKRVVLDPASIPAYPRALEMVQRGFATRGDRANLDYACALGPVEGDAPSLLRDPQTSGGLLIAAASGKSDALVEALRAAGFSLAARIGSVREGLGIEIPPPRRI